LIWSRVSGPARIVVVTMMCDFAPPGQGDIRSDLFYDCAGHFVLDEKPDEIAALGVPV